jgi:hypothetical protein
MQARPPDDNILNHLGDVQRQVRDVMDRVVANGYYATRIGVAYRWRLHFAELQYRRLRSDYR